MESHPSQPGKRVYWVTVTFTVTDFEMFPVDPLARMVTVPVTDLGGLLPPAPLPPQAVSAIVDASRTISKSAPLLHLRRAFVLRGRMPITNMPGRNNVNEARMRSELCGP